MRNEKTLVMQKIEEVFGRIRGQAWLIKSNLSLGGKTPAELIQTPEGREAVLKVLNAIAYGGAL